MATVSVRYIIDDVDAAIDFYGRAIGFHEDMHPAPTFAMLSRGDDTEAAPRGRTNPPAGCSELPMLRGPEGVMLR